MDKRETESAVSIYNRTKKPDEPYTLDFTAKKLKAISDVKKCAPLFQHIMKEENS
ncbi:MAG: hypothetical protein ACI4CS_10985 [Candidatus Weimeria sp.]